MASLKRIASELGVSYTLVSKVLSGRMGTTGVRATTRDAILEKAKELNYTPNRLAVDLKAGRKGTVGIFLHHMGIPGSDVSDRLLRGLAEGLEQSSYRMLLRFFTSDADFIAACDARLKSEVDGLIVAGVPHPELRDKLRDLVRENVPVVTLFNGGLYDPRSGLTSVGVNNEFHGCIATRHLLEQGCQHLVCFCTSKSRTEGFIRAHNEMNVKLDRRLMIPTGSFLRADGKQSLQTLLSLNRPFDGIVCQSDAQANAVINELVGRGIRIPEDVKVTGVDDSPLAEDCIIPITSVTSEMYNAGAKAGELLLQKIAGKKVKSLVIEPKLVIRRSSCGSKTK